MPKNVLVRNVADEDAAWLSTAVPPGMTQEGFVRGLISNAHTLSMSRLHTEGTDRTGRSSVGTFTFVDLFAGIGGFFAGLTAVGGRCVFTNEWDKHAVTTYRAWTGEKHVNTDDIRDLDYKKVIPDHEILAAGFPCQPFSIAGVSKKNALGREHGFRDVEQGNLFFAICDIAAAKRPPVLILENVKNLRSHDRGQTWGVITSSIHSLGYEMHDKVIDARAWVPQHRERVFMVCFDRAAFTDSEVASFRFPKPPTRRRLLGDILESDPPDKKYMLTDALWEYLKQYAAKHKAKGNGFGFDLVGREDVSRTLSARYYKDGSEILVKQRGWRNPRRLTPAEAARLMGFNSKYARMLGHGVALPQVVSDTQAYKQFGNSVCPMVVEAVGREVAKVLALRATRLDNARGARLRASS